MLELKRRISADRVLDVLTNPFPTRGVSKHIRSGHGPEFIAKAIQRHCQTAGVEMLYIGPGAPWENEFTESFFSRLRNQLLNVEKFINLVEARWFAGSRLYEQNSERPHSSLDYMAPSQVVLQLPSSAKASAPLLIQHEVLPEVVFCGVQDRRRILLRDSFSSRPQWAEQIRGEQSYASC